MKRLMKHPFAAAGWALILLGWLAGLAGWIGIQSTTRVAVQLAYLGSGGLAGVALVIIGTALWTTEDRRSTNAVLEEVRERLDALESRLPGPSPEPGGSDAKNSSGSPERVAAEG